MKTELAVLLAVASVINAAEIRGKVAETSGVLPAAKVEIINDKGVVQSTIITDMNGRFILSNLFVGSYKIRTSYLGYADVVKDVTISSDSETKDLGAITMSDRVDTMAKMKVVGTMSRDQARAQMIMQNSDAITSVIASDRIGKLPDRNAAEAVQRVAGVSIEKDQGEGRFVAVRGLPKEWNSATLNGNRIPAAEEEDLSRGTAFDFFPTDLIEYIEVNKAFTPDKEMDAMGGSINYRTKTAPDQQTLQASAAGGVGSKEIKGGENAVGRGAMNGSLLYGNRFADGKFGMLLNGTYWRRAWATDNWENRIGGDGLGIYRTELRDYTGVRQTYGGNGAFDFKFNDDHKIKFLGMYGSLNDEELHYKYRLRFDKAKADAKGDTTKWNPNTGTGLGRVEIQNIHNILITQFWGGEFATENRFNDLLKLDLSIGHYENNFHYGDVPDSKDNSYFALKYAQKGIAMTGLEERKYGKDSTSYGSMAYFAVDGGKMPNNDGVNTHLVNTSGAVIDPAKVSFADAGVYRVEKTEKDKIVLTGDLTITPTDKLELKVGGKYRDKERVESFSDEYWYFNKVNAKGDSIKAPVWSSIATVDKPGVEDFLSEVGGVSGDFGKVIKSDDIDAWWVNNRANMYMDTSESATLLNGGANGRNYSLRETHQAGYVQGKLKATDQITLLGGLRGERTWSEVNGTLTTSNESRIDTSDVEIKGLFYRRNSVTKTNDYMSWLPAFNAKYSPVDRLNLRASYARTFARPSFGDMVPGGSEMTYDQARKLGNPDLKATYANNYDFMSEYYFKGVGYLNAGVFYKQITDPVYYGTEYVGDWKESKPLNGDDASIFGIELAASKKLDFIPNKVFGGFGLEANYTYTKSSMTIPDGDLDSNNVQKFREVAIPRQADHLFNAAVFYELGGFNARLAGNFKGAFITGHAGEKNEAANEYLDEYYADYLSMDFSTSYSFNKKVTIFGEVSNLLNTPMVYTLGDPEKGRQVQTEYYGVKSLVGIKANIF